MKTFILFELASWSIYKTMAFSFFFHPKLCNNRLCTSLDVEVGYLFYPLSKNKSQFGLHRLVFVDETRKSPSQTTGSWSRDSRGSPDEPLRWCLDETPYSTSMSMAMATSHSHYANRSMWSPPAAVLSPDKLREWMEGTASIGRAAAASPKDENKHGRF